MSIELVLSADFLELDLYVGRCPGVRLAASACFTVIMQNESRTASILTSCLFLFQVSTVAGMGGPWPDRLKRFTSRECRDDLQHMSTPSIVYVTMY